MPRNFLLAISGLGMAALVSATTACGDNGSTPAPNQAAVAAPVLDPADGYDKLVHGLDQRIESLQVRSAKRDDDWLTRMHLGNALLERATLTNSIADFERVQAVLDESFAIAPDGSGPLLLAARFNFAIHRLAEAERYLDKIDARAVPRADDAAVARVMRAEIALQRGQYDVAAATLDQMGSVAPDVAGADLALFSAKTGDPTKAEALFNTALETANKKDPRRRAWLRMQLGLLAIERGQSLVALEHLNAADLELPGWWLVQEHIAEVYDRLGEHGKAIAIHEELLRRTELPEIMDALASAYQHAGEPDKATPLVERAGAAWDDQLARLPESAMGHGLQHHLLFGTPERALELAQANVAARPGGDAQVMLARAYLKAQRPADALAVAQALLATPYRTAGVHDVAARAYAAQGMTAEAKEQEALRAAINPAYDGTEHSH